MRASETLPVNRSMGRFSTSRQIAVSALWLAWFAQWMTIPPIILPNQVSAMLVNEPSRAEAVTGAVVAAGAFVALLVAPLAGALSDHTRAGRGRRRPFLVIGVLGSCAALGLLGLFGRGSSLVLYTIAYLHLQFWWNWAVGPGAGLIPDVVPEREQPLASGWTNALGILGVIIGNVLVVTFYRPGRTLPIILIFVALNLGCLLVTVVGVHEPSSTGVRPRPTYTAFLRSFYLSPRTYPDFYLVLATRLLSNMGIWSTLTFLLFYLQSVLGMPVDAASRLLPALLGIGACLAIPASLLGVRMSERYGLVFMVQVTSWIMAGATVCYVLIALHPSVALIIPVVVVFSVGNGAYGAVDWYLALKVLPRGQDTGKDFGIWHVCMVLPQIIGPATTGTLITAVRTVTSARVAYELAFGIGAFWFVLAAAFVGRVSVDRNIRAAG